MLSGNTNTADNDPENKVTLNIGGTRFETYKNILKKIPATRLSRLHESLVNYDPITNEYFFDRHPGVFSQILNYYRSGKLHYPTNVCGPLFEEELEFWGLDSNQVEPCCWKTYTTHRSTEETLATFDRLNIDVDRTSKEDLIIKFGLEEYARQGRRLPFFKRLQPILWQMFEEPRSSRAANAIAAIQVGMIVLSVAILWASSYTYAQHVVLEMKNEVLVDTSRPQSQYVHKHHAGSGKGGNFRRNTTAIYFRMIENGMSPALIVLDYITFAWFLVDISVRLIAAPSKSKFLHNFDNLIDILATLWLIIGSILRLYVNSFMLESSQVIRVMRLFRLLSYHSGLQVIISSIKTSAEVLQLLVFFILVSSTLYGALIFYAERLTTDDPDNNLFISIPNAFWFAIVSLTTIGYGDLSPVTFLGRLFGSACVVTGVIMVGLPMTIVVEVFTNYYNHLRARSKLPKQRRRILPVEAPRLRKPNTHHHQSQGHHGHHHAPK